MVLIKRDSMAATSSLLFLVPPTTAIMATLWFGEVLTPLSMVGFALASAGVYLVTYYSSPATPWLGAAEGPAPADYRPASAVHKHPTTGAGKARAFLGPVNTQINQRPAFAMSN